ncbi:hypothetical protein DEU56DRAFT_731744 [Suillus clintonianus]|uniref:uncharacterized protein n=1 Tax=Suillus clintonianus TaxID=1904413 RepID=UPI001B85BCE4|nr:uncharacterized protein DEU56DRAFT_731744 [Suillus clintonianus]KAG2146303.1 hypothetical protein DEU56DRAFT_731744 [Suillus clintonianus]
MSSSQDRVGRIIQHKDYYLRGGDLNVLIGNHLYRIHSYFFYRESLVWRQKLDAPPDSGEHGSTDASAPYTLDDVKSEDFERFLWVIYNPQYSVYDAPVETWLSILNLAHRWNFCNIKDLAIRQIETLDIEPIEKIVAYHEYKINKTLLIPAYIAMCKREKPLSLAEGMTLGMETVLRVADARERARQQAAESGIRSPTFDDFEDVQMEDMVREVFGIPPKPMSPGRHSRNSSGAFNSFGGTAIPNGSNGQKVNGEATSGLNGADPANHKPAGTLHVSTGVTEPPSTNGSTSKAEGKRPQAPPKDDKPVPGGPGKPNGAGDKSNGVTVGDKPNGAGDKPNGAGK